MWEKVDLRTCTWMRQSISPTQEFADRQPASDVDMQNIACALRTCPHERTTVADPTCHSRTFHPSRLVARVQFCQQAGVLRCAGARVKMRWISGTDTVVTKFHPIARPWPSPGRTRLW